MTNNKNRIIIIIIIVIIIIIIIAKTRVVISLVSIFNLISSIGNAYSGWLK